MMAAIVAMRHAEAAALMRSISILKRSSTSTHPKCRRSTTYSLSQYRPSLIATAETMALAGATHLSKTLPPITSRAVRCANCLATSSSAVHDMPYVRRRANARRRRVIASMIIFAARDRWSTGGASAWSFRPAAALPQAQVASAWSFGPVSPLTRSPPPIGPTSTANKSPQLQASAHVLSLRRRPCLINLNNSLYIKI